MEGLEPPTPGFGDRCSNQLSYTPKHAEAARALFLVDPARTCKGADGPNSRIAPRLRATRPPNICAKQIGRPEGARNIFDSEAALDHSMMLATTPAPTVRPPSRMAKRSFSSIAIGTISATSTVTLSPGITISVPSGSVTIPVTSVVRK